MIVKQVSDLKNNDLNKISKVFISDIEVVPVSCRFIGTKLEVNYFDIKQQRLNISYLNSDDIVHIKN